MPKQNDFQLLRGEIHEVATDVSQIKLIIAGGIDPTTGETKIGVSQKLDSHLDDHSSWKKAHERKVTRRMGYLGVFVVLLTVLVDRVLAFMGLK